MLFDFLDCCEDGSSGPVSVSAIYSQLCVSIAHVRFVGKGSTIVQHLPSVLAFLAIIQHNQPIHGKIPGYSKVRDHLQGCAEANIRFKQVQVPSDYKIFIYRIRLTMSTVFS